MKTRSRLFILAGLSDASGVKVSLLEALDRIEAEVQDGGNPDSTPATYLSESRPRRTASGRRRVGRRFRTKRVKCVSAALLSDPGKSASS
jgi:hypothetical protein